MTCQTVLQCQGHCHASSNTALTNNLIQTLVFTYLGSVDAEQFLRTEVEARALAATDRANAAAEAVEDLIGGSVSASNVTTVSGKSQEEVNTLVDEQFVEVDNKIEELFEKSSEVVQQFRDIHSFGIVGDGSDETEKLREYHSYCNTHKLAASYAGLFKISIDANASILIQTSTDFAGCEIRLLNSISTGSRYQTFLVNDPETPFSWRRGDIDDADLGLWSVTPTRGLFEETGMVHLYPTKPVCGRRPGDATLEYSQPFWVVAGESVQPLCTDLKGYGTNINSGIRPASKTRLALNNICLIDNGFNLQTFIKIERNQVDVKGILIKKETGRTLDSLDILFSWYMAGNCTLEDVHVEGRPYASGGTYVLALRSVAEFTMRNIYGLNGLQDNVTWGVTGSNYVSGCYVHNCSFNRFDIHAMGFFIHYYGGTLRDGAALQVGSGGGIFEVKGTKVIRTCAFQIRVDYGAHYENCTIKVSDIDWIPLEILDDGYTGNVALVNLGGSRVGFGGDVEVRVPNVIVNNVTVISLHDSYTVRSVKLLSLRVNNDATSVGSFENISFSNIFLNPNMRWHMDISFDGLNRRYKGVLATSNLRLNNITGNEDSINNTTPFGINNYATYKGVAPSNIASLSIYANKVNCLAIDIAKAYVTQVLEIRDSSIAYLNFAEDSLRYSIANSTFIGASGFPDLLKLPSVRVPGGHMNNTVFADNTPYDLTAVSSLNGVVVSTAVILPTNCTKEDAFYGWHKTLVNPDKNPPVEVTPPTTP